MAHQGTAFINQQKSKFLNQRVLYKMHDFPSKATYRVQPTLLS